MECVTGGNLRAVCCRLDPAASTNAQLHTLEEKLADEFSGDNDCRDGRMLFVLGVGMERLR